MSDFGPGWNVYTHLSRINDWRLRMPLILYRAFFNRFQLLLIMTAMYYCVVPGVRTATGKRVRRPIISGRFESIISPCRVPERRLFWLIIRYRIRTSSRQLLFHSRRIDFNSPSRPPVQPASIPWMDTTTIYCGRRCCVVLFVASMDDCRGNVFMLLRRSSWQARQELGQGNLNPKPFSPSPAKALMWDNNHWNSQNQGYYIYIVLYGYELG